MAPEPDRRSVPRPPNGGEDRLTSWKEIAAYLKRDVRTAERWERLEGLPVHRHVHEKRATVYAYRTELDAWLATRTRPLENGATNRRERRPSVAVAAGIITIAAGLALAVTFWPTGLPTLDFNERDWVLITEFDNRTGEDLLDGTVRAALARALSNSRFVNVVPPERVADALRLMRQPEDAPLTRSLGIEVSLRDGDVTALVTGRVEKLGSTYVIAAAVVDPVTGATVASVSHGTQDEAMLVVALQQVADDVRTTLGEALEHVRPAGGALAKVTTPSLRALQLFSQADALNRAQRPDLAEGLFREAIAEDQGFASAYMQLAEVMRRQGRPPDEFEPYAQRAFDLSATTSVRERHYIQGSYHLMFDRIEDSVAAYEALLSLHPDDYWATNHLRQNYAQLGRWDEQVRQARRQADLRPNDFHLNFLAATAISRNGPDVKLARPYVERALALSDLPTSPLSRSAELTPVMQRRWLAFFPVHESWVLGTPGAAFVELDRLMAAIVEEPAEYQWIWRVQVVKAFLVFGALEAAEAQVQLVSREDQRQDLQAAIALARGNPRPAIKLARETKAAIWLASGPATGDYRAARQALADPESSPDLAGRSFLRLADLLRGQLALADGEPTRAIAYLQGFESNPSLQMSLLASESLARAWAARGDLEQAVQTLGASSDQRRSFTALLEGWLWVRIEAERARLTRQLGREAEADRIEAGLLQLLAYADDDLQVLRDLKAARAARMAAADDATSLPSR